MPSDVLTIAGRYTLDGRLREGGMGHVYKARHIQLGKAFALKVISPAFAGDHAARQRFNQEAKLASEITHPNIVSVVDYGEDDQLGAFMVMELVDGDVLAELTLPLAIPRALNVLGQVADALSHIHQRGIVHGDVKADNIMIAMEPHGVRRRQIARLLDFGLARRSDVAAEDGVNGSPHYLAPERALGNPATVATDVYALGVLGFLLIAGALPFGGTVGEILMQHVQQPPGSLAAHRGQPVDEAIEALIARALAKDPAHRHRSVAAFRHELETVMGMLDLTRRRARGSGSVPAVSSRDAVVVEAFGRSQLAQAMISAAGVLAFANRAFVELVGVRDGGANVRLEDTALATWMPDLINAVHTCQASGATIERRANVRRANDDQLLWLVLWLSPLQVPGYEVHLLARIVELGG